MRLWWSDGDSICGSAPVGVVDDEADGEIIAATAVVFPVIAPEAAGAATSDLVVVSCSRLEPDRRRRFAFAVTGREGDASLFGNEIQQPCASKLLMSADEMYFNKVKAHHSK